MFKLVVLSALVAAVAATPGFLHGGHHLGYTAAVAAPIAHAAVVAPAAVSHVARTDVIHRPVVATAAIAAPVAHAAIAAPAVGLGYAGHLGYAGAGHLGYAGAGHLGYGYGHLGAARIGHLGYGLGYGHHLKAAHYF